MSFMSTLDVFHWSCLDEFARHLPSNTAPAGYACPGCHTCLFPASNVVSPVVDALRELLSTVNWARAGLGLPLVNIHSLFVILFVLFFVRHILEQYSMHCLKM